MGIVFLMERKKEKRKEKECNSIVQFVKKNTCGIKFGSLIGLSNGKRMNRIMVIND